MNGFVGYMAIDETTGNTYHIGNNPPRKWLLDYFGRQHVQKMYTDLKGGGHRHSGYVIAGHWLRVLRVFRWKEAE